MTKMQLKLLRQSVCGFEYEELSEEGKQSADYLVDELGYCYRVERLRTGGIYLPTGRIAITEKGKAELASIRNKNISILLSAILFIPSKQSSL